MDSRQLINDMETGLNHQRAERLEDAERIYRQVLDQHPDFADALHLYGVLESQRGRHAQAVALIERAIQQNPNQAAYYENLAMALTVSGRSLAAIDAYSKSVALNPNNPNTRAKFGIALGRMNLWERAITELSAAVRLNPGFADAQKDLGFAYLQTKQFDQSIASYKRAIDIRADFAEAYHGLGMAMEKQGAGQRDHAIAAFSKAVELNGTLPRGHHDLAVALSRAGRTSQAIKAFDAAIALWPEDFEAHYAKAMALLSLGNFQEGWREYEWRWHSDKMGDKRGFTKPRWDGRDPCDKRILLYTEQGFGDAIQFARYVPLLAARGVQVVLECQPPLQRLFGSLAGVNAVVAPGDTAPPHDLQCPLLSLPGLFGTDLQSIPATVPYLKADPVLIERWRQRIPNESRSLRVGLAWAGNATHVNDRERSISISQLADIVKIPGIWACSLQKATSAAGLGTAIADWTSDLTDFADTAALIANLDLIISVDTSVAHLGGALGKPVWVLLHYAPDWRWMFDRPDSPWYPTMQLFRQEKMGDWTEPIASIAKRLASMIYAS